MGIEGCFDDLARPLANRIVNRNRPQFTILRV
jgi:hypothetical protein